MNTRKEPGGRSRLFCKWLEVVVVDNKKVSSFMLCKYIVG